MADVVKSITGLNFHNYCHIAAALLLDNQITARADKKINAVELGPVSQKSRELCGPEKPFVKCCKGNKNKNNCKVLCLETPSF